MIILVNYLFFNRMKLWLLKNLIWSICRILVVYYFLLNNRNYLRDNKFKIEKQERKLYNKRKFKVKKQQRRYYKCSDVRLGGDKFFNIINVTTKMLSKAFTNSQLKQIPVENKIEVMKSLTHPHVELDGIFKLEKNGQEQTAFICLTHSRSHDLIDNNTNQILKVNSFFIENENENYMYMGPELRLINKDEINKIKLYNKENKLIEKKEKMNNILNNQFTEKGKIMYIDGYKDNKMKKGTIIKIEKDGEKIYKISEIKNTDIVDNSDKINKLI